MDNAWLCLQFEHRTAHLGPLCIERQITPKPRFSPCFSLFAPEPVLIIMFLAFVLYTPRSVTWGPIGHEANLCKFSTSCTDLSWKRPVLCIMRNFAYSRLTEMQIILDGLSTQVLKAHWKCHFGVFLMFMVKKRRHFSAGKTSLHMFRRHWVTHILERSNFCIRKILFSVHTPWIWAQFDHLAAPLVSRPLYTEP